MTPRTSQRSAVITTTSSSMEADFGSTPTLHRSGGGFCLRSTDQIPADSRRSPLSWGQHRFAAKARTRTAAATDLN
jgi:hypothetical protein